MGGAGWGGVGVVTCRSVPLATAIVTTLEYPPERLTRIPSSRSVT